MNQVGVGLAGSTGTGSFVGSTSPTLVTPALGTPTSGNLQNCTNFTWGSYNSSNIVLLSVSGTVSAAQIKALNASPVDIVPAQGANTFIYVNSFFAKYIYGTTPYTAGASQVIRLRYTSTATSIISTVFSNSVLTGTANSICSAPTSHLVSQAPANIVNIGVNLFNPVSTEVTNGDSTISYVMTYYVISVP